LPVALAVVALVAKNANRSGFLDQGREFVQFFPDLWRLQVFCIDLLQTVELPAASGFAAFFRRTETPQMQIGNAALIEPGRELVF
jgi:hypothetical protein